MGQELPALAEGVRLVADAREGRGPLQGMAAGLAELEGSAEAAFVSSTDVPLLHPAFVRRVLACLGEGYDVAVPAVGGPRHPLSAAYRVAVRPLVEEPIEAGRLKSGFLFERCRVRFVDAASLLEDPALAAADPDLDSLRNLNGPAEYEAARSLPAPSTRVAIGGRPNGGKPAVVPAVTLGEAALRAGVALHEDVVAAVNGDEVPGDPEFPLARGDRVAFSPQGCPIPAAPLN